MLVFSFTFASVPTTELDGLCSQLATMCLLIMLLLLPLLQAFAEESKLLPLLAQLLQQDLGATLAALPAAELSSNAEKQQQQRAAAKEAGIAAADSWDLGEAAVRTLPMP
jgi:hypothetical protein